MIRTCFRRVEFKIKEAVCQEKKPARLPLEFKHDVPKCPIVEEGRVKKKFYLLHRKWGNV